MNDNVWAKIFSTAAAGWTLVCMALVTLFKAWPLIMDRLNERQRDSAAEKAGDWQRLREERDHALEENKALRALLAECERISLERLSRAVTAEAALIGFGEARQQTTILRGMTDEPKKGGK